MTHAPGYKESYRAKLLGPVIMATGAKWGPRFSVTPKRIDTVLQGFIIGQSGVAAQTLGWKQQTPCSTGYHKEKGLSKSTGS